MESRMYSKTFVMGAKDSPHAFRSLQKLRSEIKKSHSRVTTVESAVGQWLLNLPTESGKLYPKLPPGWGLDLRRLIRDANRLYEEVQKDATQ